MKQKKLIIVSAVLLLSAVGMFADTAIFVGPAYTNYLVKTKVSGDGLTSPEVKKILGDAIGNVKDERNNTAAFAIDLRGSFFYLMAQMAFPGASHSDVVKASLNKEFNWKGIMLDTQLGGGITLFKKSPLNLFVGAGAGLNTIYTNQDVDAGTLGKISYTRFDLMAGAGVNILASLYLAEHLGIYVGVADTLYFIPIKAEKLFSGGSLSQKIELTQSNQNSNVKNNFANSLNIKAGLTIKF